MGWCPPYLAEAIHVDSQHRPRLSKNPYADSVVIHGSKNFSQGHEFQIELRI